MPVSPTPKVDPQRKADLDNHSRQLDPKNPEYHRSRGDEPPKSQPKK